MNTGVGFINAIIFGVLLAGCGAQVSVGGNPVNGVLSKDVITLDSILNIQKKNWKMDSKERAWVNKRAVQFAGTCSRAVKQVQAMLQGKTLFSTACQSDGTFHGSYSFSKDGEAPLHFAPVMLTQTPGNEIVQTVVIKTLPPAKPVITTHQGKDFSSSLKTVRLEGQSGSDTVAIHPQGASGVLISSGDFTQFAYVLQMNLGEVKNASFVAVDFVGNQSEPVSIQVSYDAGIVLSFSEWVSNSLSTSLASTDGRVSLQAASVGSIIQVSSQVNAQQTLSTGLPTLWSLYE